MFRASSVTPVNLTLIIFLTLLWNLNNIYIDFNVTQNLFSVIKKHLHLVVMFTKVRSMKNKRNTLIRLRHTADHVSYLSNETRCGCGKYATVRYIWSADGGTIDNMIDLCSPCDAGLTLV